MASVLVPTSLAEAKALDAADPLAAARMAFYLPDDLIYLDGHSLGAATHAALAGALDVFDQINMVDAAKKTRALGDLCLARCEALGLPSPSPAIGEMRGGHVSVLQKHGYAMVQALAAAGVIADFRAPDLIRFGFSALYTRYQDVWRAMNEMERIVNTASWDAPEFKKVNAVT